MSKKKEERIGEDIPFGHPPEYYSYRCSNCRHEMYDGSYYEGFMPVLGCPGCYQETIEYIRK